MPEVIGVCKSVTREEMIITDLDGDDIEMSGFWKDMPDLDLERTKTQFLGKKISFYHDHHGMRIRLLKDDEPLLWQHSSNPDEAITRRTAASVFGWDSCTPEKPEHKK